MSKIRLYNKTLCPLLWNNMKLNPEVRIHLLKIAKDFYEKTEFKAPIKDIYFMGSAANYNWTPDSDIDIHILIDFKQLQMPEDTAFQATKTASSQWNFEHDILIKGHQVEMNFQDSADTKPHVTGMYSLVSDTWIRTPRREILNVNKVQIIALYNKLKVYIEKAILTGQREYMKSVKEYIDSLRQYGLDTHGELSKENIAFKILRSRGIVKKLKDAITKTYDRQMSVDEVRLIKEQDNIVVNDIVYQWNHSECIGPFIIFESNGTPHYIYNINKIKKSYLDGDEISDTISTYNKTHPRLLVLLSSNEIKVDDKCGRLEGRTWKIDNKIYVAWWNEDITKLNIGDLSYLLDECIYKQSGETNDDNIFIYVDIDSPSQNNTFISYREFKQNPNKETISKAQVEKNQKLKDLHLMSPLEKAKALDDVGVKPKVGDTPDWKRKAEIGVDEIKHEKTITEAIKWKRLEAGEVFFDSEDGRFSIIPQYIGRTRPQNYKVVDNQTQKTHLAHTLRDAFQTPERFWLNQKTPPPPPTPEYLQAAYEKALKDNSPLFAADIKKNAAKRGIILTDPPMSEITQKDINQVHPTPYAPDSLKKMTLSNLKALRAKAGRFWRGAVDSGNEDVAKSCIEDWKRFDREIKKRLEYINAPVMEEGYGAGKPEDDPKIPKGKRWTVKYDSTSSILKENVDSLVTVYTGSDAPFTKFDLNKIGSRTDDGFAGRGAYTTIDKDKAGRWGKHIMSTQVNPNDKWVDITGISQLGHSPMPNDISTGPRPKRNEWFKSMITKWTADKMKEGYVGVRWKLSTGDIQYVLFYPDKYEWSVVNDTTKEGFDPTSAGPNPQATEGQPPDPNFYREHNKKMRTMERISFKSLAEIYSGGIPRFLYHATLNDYYPSIVEKGLVPGGICGQNFPGCELGVYLGSTKDFAGSMLAASENENRPDNWYENAIILTIDIGKIDNKKLFEKDPHVNLSSKSNEKSFLYRGIIPSSAIIKVEDGYEYL